jgi:hypothetical protein
LIVGGVAYLVYCRMRPETPVDDEVLSST